ncbi:histidine kinase [Marinilabiliaceae bacterium JC017]|nr:histidine kinase [Marinilabiliaceae bacterium JC017]
MSVVIFIVNYFLCEYDSNSVPNLVWDPLRIIGIFFHPILLYVSLIVDYKLVHLLQKRLPWGKKNYLRLFFEFLLTLLWSVFFLFLSFMSVTKLLDILNYPYDMREVKASFAVNIIFMEGINGLFVAIMEGRYFFQQWKKSLMDARELAFQTEKLEKENVSLRFEALKAQLNPHFLFNNLSVLSSLCYPEPSPLKAKQFIDEFSRIYRYILSVRDELIVDLNQELLFLDAYVFLLKLRFEAGIVFNVDVDDGSKQLLLPPLTLQMLVENAMKHNEVSLENPLVIDIVARQDTLVVKNNINRKSDVESPGGFGNQRLFHYYGMMSEMVPVIEESEECFVVRLPLLKDE